MIGSPRAVRARYGAAQWGGIVSITVGTVCLTCKKSAPNVGDFGQLGEPSLVVSKQIHNGRKPGEFGPSFEYFYEALRGIGIFPYDLHRFREFLAAHEGHFLFTYAETEFERPEFLPEEVVEWERAQAEDGYPSLEEDDVFEEEQERRVAAGEFVMAGYEMMCTRCGVQHSTSSPELLRAARPLDVSPEAAAIFVERWGVYPDEGWNHRLMGIADPYEPFMEELIDFVRTHGTHGLRASLQTSAT
jgi:hypothetical protein